MRTATHLVSEDARWRFASAQGVDFFEPHGWHPRGVGLVLHEAPRLVVVHPLGMMFATVVTMSRWPLLAWVVCLACAPIHRDAPSVRDESATRQAAPLHEWEGFFALTEVTQPWLDSQGLPLRIDALSGLRARMGKLVLDNGEKESTPGQLLEIRRTYCSESAQPFNESLCQSVARARCENDRCTYRHFENCSGFFIGGGRFLTAAHCLEPLVRDDALRRGSVVLPLDAEGKVRAPLPVGAITLGKTVFDRDWVAVAEADPVDAAITQLADDGLPSWPLGPVPERGSLVFMFGFPRSDMRSEQARHQHHYSFMFGTPSVSFGRILDRNERDAPLCNVDGQQEHWRLQEGCQDKVVVVGGQTVQAGRILTHPFLSSIDSTNGYSGGSRPRLRRSPRWRQRHDRREWQPAGGLLARLRRSRHGDQPGASPSGTVTPGRMHAHPSPRRLATSSSSSAAPGVRNTRSYLGCPIESGKSRLAPRRRRGSADSRRFAAWRSWYCTEEA